MITQPIQETIEEKTRDPYGPGFYKLDTEILYAPNFVKNKDFELYKEDKDTYSYPIEGWYWFENEEEACLYFGIEYLFDTNS